MRNRGVFLFLNNAAENIIRPFVVGRKNWLFSGTQEGAAASAVLYSLVETAKANGLEPFSYFRYLFGKLPVAETLESAKKEKPGKTRDTPQYMYCLSSDNALTFAHAKKTRDTPHFSLVAALRSLVLQNPVPGLTS
jgi:hypothetical protein